VKQREVEKFHHIYPASSWSVDNPHTPTLQLDIFVVTQTAGDGKIQMRQKTKKNGEAAASESVNRGSWLHERVSACNSNHVLVRELLPKLCSSFAIYKKTQV